MEMKLAAVIMSDLEEDYYLLVWMPSTHNIFMIKSAHELEAE